MDIIRINDVSLIPPRQAPQSVRSVGILLKTATYFHIAFIDILFSMYAGGLVYLVHFEKFMDIRQLEIRTASIVAILSVCGFMFYMFALNTGPASIVYPIVSLNCMIVIVSSVLFFKERLKMYQVVGLIVAIFGLILVKI